MKANSRKTLHGVTICNGLVVSSLVRVNQRESTVSAPNEAHSPDKEWSNFATAQSKSLDKIQLLLEESGANQQQGELASVMEGYELLITDVLLVERIKSMIFEERLNATSAVEKAFAEAKKQLSTAGFQHVKEKSLDIVACEDMLLNSLKSEQIETKLDFLKDRIVVVGHPTPQEVIRFHQAGVAGIVCEHGSHLSHAAILARSFNIPTLFSVPGALKNSRSGHVAILNATEKNLVINPSRAELRKAEARRAVELMMTQKLRSKSTSIARTLDGHRISVCANANGPTDARNLISFGAEGIGLLRTEFLHLTSGVMPTPEESTVFFKLTADSFAPKWVTIRLLDAGGDKPYPGGNSFPSGPFGVRGVRFLLAEKRILEDQITAIIKANSHGNLRILIPFVSDINEVRLVKSKVNEIWNSIPQDERASLHYPQLGAMIETPSACMLLDLLSSECDFLSIGSNDLTQHILCVDRDSSLETGQLNSFHPSVLRALATIFEIQKKIDISISLCGEIASDPVAIELLMGLGCRHLSVRMSSIPLIKDIIRNLNLAEAEKLAQFVLRMSSSEEIIHCLNERYESLFEDNYGTAVSRNQAS